MMRKFQTTAAGVTIDDTDESGAPVSSLFVPDHELSARRNWLGAMGYTTEASADQPAGSAPAGRVRVVAKKKPAKKKPAARKSKK